VQRIDIKPSSRLPGADSILYRADRSSNTLLVWIDADGEVDVAGIEKLARVLTDEGWNVLHVRTAPDANAHTIVETIAAAVPHSNLSVGPPRIIAVAEASSVAAACTAVLDSHQRNVAPAISGLVAIDATPDGTADPWASLAGISGLTTFIAARLSAGEARLKGLAYHRQLQSLERNAHFMVLADGGRSVATQLADPRDAFSREVRWLLEPVNSRTDDSERRPG
jgi:hypothetical protein